MEKYASGRYSQLEFLSAVSHCTGITETLTKDNSDTEEYSWDESVTDDSTNTASSHSSAAYAVSVASASTSSDNFCDIVGLIKEQELCLFRVAMHVSAIRVPVNCLLLPRHVASADNKLTC